MLFRAFVLTNRSTISVMKFSFAFRVHTCTVAMVMLRGSFSVKAYSQALTKTESQAPTVKLITLVQLTFPPLARTARISGDVHVDLLIKKDGTVESVKAVSGPSLLTYAAVENAKQLKFECQGCQDEFTPYTLVYTYKLSDSEGTNLCGCSSKTPLPKPVVTQSSNHITIQDSPACISPDGCDPKFNEKVQKYRSLKCAYLWKCGNHHYGVQ
jgi:hypothetical protein